MARVSVGVAIPNIPSYCEAREIYVNQCTTANCYNSLNYLTLINESNDNGRIIMTFSNNGRYYTVSTYDPQVYQLSCYRPYESLAFDSDVDGNPTGDPFNNGYVNNTGENKEKTHYSTIYDLSCLLNNPYLLDEDEDEQIPLLCPLCRQPCQNVTYITSNDRCVVCWEQFVTIQLNPCRHQCLCHDCYSMMQR